MENDKKNADAEPQDPSKDGTPDEEARRQALRKRKPLGPVMKPLSKEEIEQLLRDPEGKERDNLLDAMPKGYDTDYQDEF